MYNILYIIASADRSEFQDTIDLSWPGDPMELLRLRSDSKGAGYTATKEPGLGSYRKQEVSSG